MKKQELLHRMEDGAITRRQVNRLLAAAGVALVAMPVTRRTAEAAGDQATFFTWAGYDTPDFFAPYVKKHGKPNTPVFADEQEAFQKLHAGFVADVAHPCSGRLVRWRDAGVDQVEIIVSKPAAAWRGIAYVERLNIDLAGMREPTVLFEGAAREGVPHFPANVNIAAVLSMAGIGFDRTRLKVVADPTIKHNTHQISVRGKTGNISIKLENVPAPENPKTAWLACYSALAALKLAKSPIRYGT